VAKLSAPDGYTLLAASNTVAMAPAFKKEPGYDVNKDLVGIGDMQSVARHRWRRLQALWNAPGIVLSADPRGQSCALSAYRP